MNRSRYEIKDEESHRAWEELCGFKIYADYVYVTPSFYKEHHQEIYAIQMGSALKHAFKR